MNNNLLNSALRQAAKNLSTDYKLVETVYRSYWGFIREYIESLSIKKMTEEESEKTTTNINIPYIGKLYVDYGKIENYKWKLKKYEDAKIKKNKANRLSGTGD